MNICNISIEYRREHHPQCSSNCMTYARVSGCTCIHHWVALFPLCAYLTCLLFCCLLAVFAFVFAFALRCAAAAAFAALRTARFHHSVAERCRVKLRLRFTLNILRRGTCTILLLPTQF